MKKVVDGKRYDTESAEFIESYEYGCGTFQYESEALYRTPKGAWFVAGEGGPRSKYAVALSYSEWCGGKSITPLTETEAFAWCQKHAGVEVIDCYFAHLVEIA